MESELSLFESELMKKILEGQHKILIQELAKIEKLNEEIERRRGCKEKEHVGKMESYEEIIKALDGQIKEKEAIIAKIGEIGHPPQN